MSDLATKHEDLQDHFDGMHRLPQHMMYLTVEAFLGRDVDGVRERVSERSFWRTWAPFSRWDIA